MIEEEIAYVDESLPDNTTLVWNSKNRNTYIYISTLINVSIMWFGAENS